MVLSTNVVECGLYTVTSLLGKDVLVMVHYGPVAVDGGVTNGFVMYVFVPTDIMASLMVMRLPLNRRLRYKHISKGGGYRQQTWKNVSNIGEIICLNTTTQSIVIDPSCLSRIIFHAPEIARGHISIAATVKG